jgi:hypothetical protein
MATVLAGDQRIDARSVRAFLLGRANALRTTADWLDELAEHEGDEVALAYADGRDDAGEGLEEEYVPERAAETRGRREETVGAIRGYAAALRREAERQVREADLRWASWARSARVAPRPLAPELENALTHARAGDDVGPALRRCRDDRRSVRGA